MPSPLSAYKLNSLCVSVQKKQQPWTIYYYNVTVEQFGLYLTYNKSRPHTLSIFQVLDLALDCKDTIHAFGIWNPVSTFDQHPMINLEQTEKNMFDHIQPNPFSVLHNASYQLSSILIAWKYLQQDIITNTASKLTKTNQGIRRGSSLEEVSHLKMFVSVGLLAT